MSNIQLTGRKKGRTQRFRLNNMNQYCEVCISKCFLQPISSEPISASVVTS